jgi:hypothetical protein
MRMRPLAGMVVLGVSLAALAADSLHLEPAGTVVSGSFDLAGKEIPLPTGEFVIAATERRAQLAGVFLAQLDGQTLRSAVWASSWPGESKEKRLTVERRAASFGADAGGLLKDAAAWLAYHDVELPVPVMIVAEIARSQGGRTLRVSYAFNPWSYGCHSRHERFVESVTAWAEAVERGEPPRAGIHQCASALARHAHNIAAPRTPLASPCSARTMRVSTLCE